MASFLDAVFIPDHVVAFLAQEQSEGIVQEFGEAANTCPQLFEYLLMRARIGAPLVDDGESPSDFEIGQREGARAMVLEILSIVKAATMSNAELEELITERS